MNSDLQRQLLAGGTRWTRSRRSHGYGAERGSTHCHWRGWVWSGEWDAETALGSQWYNGTLTV